MPSIQPKQSATSTALVQSIDVTPVPFLAIRTHTCVAVDALSTSQVSNALSSSKNTASVWTIDMAAAYGHVRSIWTPGDRPASRTTAPMGPRWRYAPDRSQRFAALGRTFVDAEWAGWDDRWHGSRLPAVESFIAVTDSRHFGRAADRLG